MIRIIKCILCFLFLGLGINTKEYSVIKKNNNYNINLINSEENWYRVIGPDGNVIKEENFNLESEIILPPGPYKEGTEKYSYIFLSWNKAILADGKIFIYTPNYTEVINEYEYLFLDYDNKELKRERVVYGSIILEPESPFREKTPKHTFQFIGWDKEIPNEITFDIVFRAKYQEIINQYTYKFIDKDNEIIKEGMINYGEKIIEPNAPKLKNTVLKKYKFIGWNKEIPTEITEDVIFKAEYKEYHLLTYLLIVIFIAILISQVLLIIKISRKKKV